MTTSHVPLPILVGGDSPLTAKQTQCLRLAAQGMSREEIAAQLHLSWASVMFQLQRAAQALGVAGLQAAIDRATLHEWI